ncbi:MAG TPA: GNAT family N-acetyltransferase [Solirubrobacter sp.]|nr:GNAT family N-acetyltransferase [Solirubrobacter sp.]
MRLEGSLGFEALVPAVDALLGSVRHRKLHVVDETVGEALRPEFAAAGWVCDRHVTLRRAAPARADASVEEVALVQTHALRIEWYLDYGNEPAEQVALAAAQDRVGARRGMRAFVVRAGGAPVGFALLAVGPGAVEIDQLYVTPAARGRGLGARLVESALAAGGAPVAWIVADADGPARALYERLGFETAWLAHQFTRLPD